MLLSTTFNDLFSVKRISASTLGEIATLLKDELSVSFDVDVTASAKDIVVKSALGSITLVPTKDEYVRVTPTTTLTDLGPIVNNATELKLAYGDFKADNVENLANSIRLKYMEPLSLTELDPTCAFHISILKKTREIKCSVTVAGKTICEATAGLGFALTNATSGGRNVIGIVPEVTFLNLEGPANATILMHLASWVHGKIQPEDYVQILHKNVGAQKEILSILNKAGFAVTTTKELEGLYMYDKVKFGSKLPVKVTSATQNVALEITIQGERVCYDAQEAIVAGRPQLAPSTTELQIEACKANGVEMIHAIRYVENLPVKTLESNLASLNRMLGTVGGSTNSIANMLGLSGELALGVQLNQGDANQTLLDALKGIVSTHANR